MSQVESVVKKWVEIIDTVENARRKCENKKRFETMINFE